eukprot:9883640-Karenia_brevis.AAC.1
MRRRRRRRRRRRKRRRRRMMMMMMMMVMDPSSHAIYEPRGARYNSNRARGSDYNPEDEAMQHVLLPFAHTCVSNCPAGLPTTAPWDCLAI